MLYYTGSGVDYDSVMNTITFSATTTDKTLTITTNTDSVVEGLEVFTLSLTTTDDSVYLETLVSIEDATGKLNYSQVSC